MGIDEHDTDERLMLRAGRGDRDACAQLVERYLAKVVAFAGRMLGDRDAAQDVAQEVFLRLWTHAASWQPGSARLSTWLHRVAFNLCLDRSRRRRETPLEATFDVADPQPHSVMLMHHQDIARHVIEALQKLPITQRTAIVLCHYQDLRNTEAAEVMEISVDALESLLARARRALRERLRSLAPDLLGGLA